MEVEKTEGKSFTHALRVEWTTLWKSRILLIGIMVAVVPTVWLGLYSISTTQVPVAACGSTLGVNTPCSSAAPVPTSNLAIGPDGEVVNDKFYFVYQSLVGNGSITTRLTSMTGEYAYAPPGANPNVPSIILKPGVEPWAKAGIIIKESLKQGTPYAAMLLTGSHGIRMQYNFIQDIAGLPGHVSAVSPRWLRLTRSGETLTGYESIDGTQWTIVGTTNLAGLPATVQVGLFVTSPCNPTDDGSGSDGSGSSACLFAQATVAFDHVSLQGEISSATWSRDDVGTLFISGQPHHPGSLVESGGTFTVTGNGDIAPLGDLSGPTIQNALIGAVVGMMVLIIVAVLFAFTERSSGRTRIAKRVRPAWRVVAAKALVFGLVAFATQLVALVITVQLSKRIILADGGFQLVGFEAISLLTELRITIGTATAVALATVFALALGALFQRRIVAVLVGLALTFVPFGLALAELVPDSVSGWLFRLMPAAGFAIQQALPAYPQVAGTYPFAEGYYPLAPWVGFAVLYGYTVLALGLALFLARRTEARSEQAIQV